jgi:hypothetical protein
MFRIRDILIRIRMVRIPYTGLRIRIMLFIFSNFSYLFATGAVGTLHQV